LFQRKRNGFFIEAGASDGISFSNTLYFEAKLGWTGLLVEPNPDDFSKLKQLKRKAFAFGHCLSTKTTPETVLFDASGKPWKLRLIKNELIGISFFEKGLLGGIINCGKKPTKGDEFEVSKNVLEIIWNHFFLIFMMFVIVYKWVPPISCSSKNNKDAMFSTLQVRFIHMLKVPSIDPSLFFSKYFKSHRPHKN